MNERQRSFASWLEEQAAACKRRGKLLAEDDRMDEGNFEKIRANVYEIFKAVLSAAGKVCGEDDAARLRFFLEKAEQIPASWAASYEKAKQNDDVEKLHIERVKLDTIQEIKAMCAQIWGEAV